VNAEPIYNGATRQAMKLGMRLAQLVVLFGTGMPAQRGMIAPATPSAIRHAGCDCRRALARGARWRFEAEGQCFGHAAG
jgi:hypothetical protein